MAGDRTRSKSHTEAEIGLHRFEMQTRANFMQKIYFRYAKRTHCTGEFEMNQSIY